MLRALVALLFLANLVFWGWTQGWFEPGWPPPQHAEREPARLAAQVRPEALTVVPARAASEAVLAARAAAAVCLEAGPFADAAVADAEAALAPAALAEGSWARSNQAAPAVWLVFAGRYADATLRRARQEELKKLGLVYEALSAPSELAPGLVLSRHSSQEAAEASLATVAAGTALRGAKVVLLPGPAPTWWLRVARAEPDVALRLLALPAEALAGGFKPCVARP